MTALLGTMAGTAKLSDRHPGPQITAAPNGWQSKLILVDIQQQVVNDGFVQESAQQVEFSGVVQPLSPKQIMLKPEGQRAWTWLQIHVMNNSPVKLNVNDRIMYNCRKYKIMARNDYTANGYMEFHAVEDFQ